MKRSILILSVACALLLTFAAEGSGWAQSDAPPPAAVATTSSGGTGAGFGIGAATFLSGLSGIDAVYDMPRLHIEGLIGFNSVSGQGANNMTTVTNFQFGVRGWYHLHNGSRSDFSAGGGLGVVTVSGGMNPPTATVIEPGFQARVFLTPNFALHMTGGLTMRVGNSVNVNQTNIPTGFGLTAQLLAGVGFTYFFI